MACGTESNLTAKASLPIYEIFVWVAESFDS